MAAGVFEGAWLRAGQRPSRIEHDNNAIAEAQANFCCLDLSVARSDQGSVRLAAQSLLHRHGGVGGGNNYSYSSPAGRLRVPFHRKRVAIALCLMTSHINARLPIR